MNNIDNELSLNLIDLSSDNVYSNIKLIIENIPKDATPLEKIRWLYKMLGLTFSYDYRVAVDKNYDYTKGFEKENYVSRYQTCIQISNILNEIYNNIDGVKSRIITRSLSNIRGKYNKEHTALEVMVDDCGFELKLLIDLTLDLYLIQSNSLTKHFGYEDDGTGSYDIISQIDNKKMDEKLGLTIKDRKYTNILVEEYSEKLLKEKGLSPKEKIDRSIEAINMLYVNFKGKHESKQYTNYLLSKLMQAYYKEYNLFYKENDKIDYKTVYKLELDGYERWVINSLNSGLKDIAPSLVKEMLDNGFTTNSKTLNDELSPVNMNDKKM